MGFLNKLFGKKEKTPAPATESPRLSLGIPPTDSYLVAYKAVFYEIMGTIKTLTPEEVDAAFALQEKRHTAENKEELSGEVFERFFSDRDHIWPELEEWNAVFVQQGREAILVHKLPETFGVQNICDHLKVADIKKAMKQLGVAFPSSAAKGDLATLLEQAITPAALVDAIPEWATIVETIRRKSRQSFFNMLQAVIWMRAKSRDDAERRKSIGATASIVYQPEWEKPFVDMALEKDPAAVPPFFPGSKTYYDVQVPGFARRTDRAVVPGTVADGSKG